MSLPPDNLLELLPYELTRRKIELMTYNDARKLTQRAFIKPPDFKSFQAKVYDVGTLPEDSELGPQNVIVSEVVEWEVEFRCFVREGDVIDVSAYARYGKLNVLNDTAWNATAEETTAAIKLAREVLNQTKLPPAALDVGLISGRGWAVVEANAAWASGLYGCDPRKILPVIQSTCQKL